MFRLNENEFESLMSQIATSKRGGRRKLPYMFSEHGVLMLSSVLNSKQAIQVNIQVMRIFTRIRQMLMDNTDLRLEIEKIKTKLDSQGKNMELVFRYLDELIEKKSELKPRKRIGFKKRFSVKMLWMIKLLYSLFKWILLTNYQLFLIKVSFVE